MLRLYLSNVPAFESKVIGELVIREYLGSVYPERLPRYLDPGAYRRLIVDLSHLVANR
jgi:hypothetical protein